MGGRVSHGSGPGDEDQDTSDGTALDLSNQINHKFAQLED
jgi:hypothetical protein